MRSLSEINKEIGIWSAAIFQARDPRHKAHCVKRLKELTCESFRVRVRLRQEVTLLNATEFEHKKLAWLQGYANAKTQGGREVAVKHLLELTKSRHSKLPDDRVKDLVQAYIKNFTERNQVSAKQQLDAFVDKILLDDGSWYQPPSAVMLRVDSETGDNTTPTGWNVSQEILFNCPQAVPHVVYALSQLAQRLEMREDVVVSTPSRWLRKPKEKTLGALEVYRKNKHNTFLKIVDPHHPEQFMDVFFANQDGHVGVVEYFKNARAGRNYVLELKALLRDKANFHEVEGELFRNPLKDV